MFVVESATGHLPSRRRRSIWCGSPNVSPTPVVRRGPVRRGWCVLRAGAGNDVGRGVDLHSAPRSPGCSPSAIAARWNRRWTCPGTGSTATCFTSAPTIGDDATVGARTTLLPGCGGRQERGRSPRIQGGGQGQERPVLEGLPGVKSGKARHPWPDHRPPSGPRWWPSRRHLGASRRAAAAALGAGAVVGWAVRDAGTLQADRRPGAAVGARSRRWSPSPSTRR